MPTLDLSAILCIGLLVGNELAVSLFVHPAIWKLEDAPQSKILALLARSLGKVMPVWYALALAFLAAEAFLRRRGPSHNWLYAAFGIWTLTIVYTVLFLVPINNRIAGLEWNARYPGWRNEHMRWDALHRVRIALLAASFACFVWAVVANR